MEAAITNFKINGLALLGITPKSTDPGAHATSDEGLKTGLKKSKVLVLYHCTLHPFGLLTIYAKSFV